MKESAATTNRDPSDTFAVYFGNRGFFPEQLIAQARREMTAVLRSLGYGALLMDETLTRYGAVESVDDGRKYAAFLKANRGKYSGVILCLPNFGDETGAIEALQDCGVPILIHAYPDEPGKMGFSQRRDAFCGKFSIMDVFCQYGLPFTTFRPHTVAPNGDLFAQHLRQFAAVCRIVNRMRRMTVGAIGARTTAFKTVRFDELTLQRYGITTEALDLSEVFQRVRDVKATDDAFAAKADRLRGYTNWTGVPAEKFEMLVKLSVVLDRIVADYRLDCMALRCWIEIEKELGVSPCVLLSELNDRGIVAACELDVCNAVPMFALALASERPATCLDWNNNYGNDPDKCILFHCGPVPQGLMAAKGQVIDHPMFAKAMGAGCGWGCNVGRIAPAPMTFASTKTADGKLWCYLGEGAFTADTIENDFFGCAGVVQIPNLQAALEYIGHEGYRHHVGVTAGHVSVAVREAFTRYLGYELKML
jgi:L-fucose isomerase-like protein